ncbi:MAG: CHAP domain-containing protein [Ruminococcus sp.]|nr:CHAP domain-containing protein [Ruminococcus sp.]
MSITYDEFIKNHKGKACDTDGVCGAQCVDLAIAYMYEVFDSGIKNFWFDAHHFYDNFNSNDWLKKNLTRIANTPDFVPQKGDIAVWKSSLSSGGWGHIAICTGEGNTTYFYSYDQNWTGKNDPCTKIKHNYSHFAGVLRPKDQSKINPKILDSSGFKKGDKSDGVLALKQLLMLAGYKLDNNGTFGEGTLKAVNALLKKWGYSENGVAGTKFIKKLSENIK